MSTPIAKQGVQLLKPNGHFYRLTESLNDAERAILEQLFTAQPLAHWRDTFEYARIPSGIVKAAAETTTVPQVLTNEIIMPIESGGEHLTRTVSSLISIHGVPKAKARRLPELGELIGEGNFTGTAYAEVSR